MQDLARAIDAINEWTGKTVRWLVIPLTLIVVLEVTLRYVFNSPTIWAWDVNVQILGAMVILSGGNTMLHNSFISVDIFSSRLSPKSLAVKDMITSALFFLSIGAFLWQATGAAWKSFLVRETMNTYFRPPIYPLRMVIVLGVLLLLLQGISKFIRDFGIVTGKDWSKG